MGCHRRNRAGRLSHAAESCNDSFPLKENSVPVLLVQSDADTLVPAAGTRQWVETMKELKMDHKYVEIPGAGNGDVIEKGMEDISSRFSRATRNDNAQETCSQALYRALH